jgi:hypothetical protein
VLVLGTGSKFRDLYCRGKECARVVLNEMIPWGVCVKQLVRVGEVEMFVLE